MEKKNTKVVRLTENDIENLVRKIIQESKTDAVVRYTEPELIKHITNLLVTKLGHDPKKLPKDLDALHEILWEESQDYKGNIPDDVMEDIHDLLSEVGLIKGDYNQVEDDYEDDDYMEDMDWVKSVVVPGFTQEELNKIKETVARLLSPGFHEDYEVADYLSTVSDNDPKTEKLLVSWLKSQGLNFYQPEYRDYMDDDYSSNTPIKPITIQGKTYDTVEDLPLRELGIGSYLIEDGIVMVDGHTPLQDVIADMDVEDDYMDEY